MHHGWVVPFDEIWFVAVAAKEIPQVPVAHTPEHCGVVDLVAVQVQDWQDGAVARRIQKLVRMPARSKRPSLPLTISDHTADKQLRIVKCRSIGVGKRISQLAAFVNRSRRFRRDMTGNASRKRELLEELLHAFGVF